MTFSAPAFLWVLLLVPALIGVGMALRSRRMRYAIRFTNMEVLEGVLPRRRQWRRLVPVALYLLALSSLVVALARPQAEVSVPRERATVVLSIDTSGSMEATDVEPSRLSAAQSAARTFLDQLPDQFQVGLVSFSDQAEVLAQPTTDRAAVREAIASLRPLGGTAMGDALARALELNGRAPSTSAGRTSPPLRSSRAERPLDAVLLLSDGYSTTGDVEPLEAAELARDRGTPTFTIALGTPEGVVEGQDQYGRPALIRVPPDPDTLRAIAETTGGEFFTAPTEDELRQVYEELGSRIGYVKERREVTSSFAAAAAVLVALASAGSLAWNGRLP
ncbi:VWA domain-containing protein [soil metagenome]